MTDEPRNPALGLPLHEFPYPWASEWGEDEHGIWIAFTYKKIRYPFRWITPGTFLMGSPKDEPERSDNELKHEVTLTKGFWLGETMVTQALWQAVMGENPSEFKGEDKPVEQVSWDDTQKFIKAFHGINPDLGLRLPTEAEWEYACRAGITTPFHFGNQIDPSQVNYHGELPYNQGEKGKFRLGTVEVRALPSNAWGLYQMHGNVDEWCQDWFGDYEPEHAVDLRGPDSGEVRVLRGAGWIDGASWCRSASRFRRSSSDRGNDVGFRLAAVAATRGLGQTVRSARVGQRGPSGGGPGRRNRFGQATAILRRRPNFCSKN